MDWISPQARRRVGLAGVVIGILGVASAKADEPPQHGEIRVARLIRELGAGEFARRPQAEEQLAGSGASARRSLEEALHDDDLEVRLRAKRVLERMQLDELWAGARLNYSAAGQPASKVLSVLAAQSGNHIHVGDPYGNFAEKPLEVEFNDVGYWQALDEVCHLTGNRIRPHYDAHTPGIVVSAGSEGKYPRAYGGPMRAQIIGARREFVEELNYEERKADLKHVFQISLQLTWEDRFRLVGYATQPVLVEAMTDNGAVITAAQSANPGWNASGRGLRQVTATMKLNPVPMTAKTLDVFRIKWGLIAVGEMAVLDMDQVEPQKVYSQDDVAVRIEAVEKQSGSKYAVTLSIARDLAMPEPQEVVCQEYDVELLDAGGRPFRLQDQSPALTDRGVQLKLSFAGELPDSEPRSMTLRYPRVRARREVELVFRDVPLPVGRPD
jgi:hypothetical protein